MSIYPLDVLINLAHSRDIIPYPYLEKFANQYASAITQDKDAPLFSRTHKYSSFPVRCQWKPGTSGQPGDSSKKSGKRESSRKKKESEQSDEWRRSQEDLPSITPTKIKKMEGIRGDITRILNKITPDNFEVQSNEFLTILQKSDDSSTVKLLAELILEKVWYDKSFYNLYVSLLKKLWSDETWIENAYKIFQMKTHSGMQYFYSTFYEEDQKTKSLNGPFKTEEEAKKDVLKKVHLRSVFLALCRDNFEKRESFILESIKLPDSTKRYKLRRKLFGTVEITGQFYSMGYLSDNVMHYILLTLLHNGKGSAYEEEIEAFQLAWNIVKNKLSSTVHDEYRILLEKEHERGWSSRVRFMIQDILESIPSYRMAKKVNTITKPVEKEVPIEETPETVDEMAVVIKKMVKASREGEVQREQVLDSLHQWVTSTKATSVKVKQLSVKIATQLVKDAVEYTEHTDDHVLTLKKMLKSKDCYFTCNELSEALSEGGEDISELKLDAPKAPGNMVKLLVGILQDTDDILNICISPLHDEDMDYEEYEKCQKAEWDLIVKQVMGKVGKEQSSRIELFSLNNV